MSLNLNMLLFHLTWKVASKKPFDNKDKKYESFSLKHFKLIVLNSLL